MGLLDIQDDIEDFTIDDGVQEDSNKYLSDKNEAIKLVSQIIPLANNNYSARKNIHRLDNMLDIDFLSVFNHVQLTNEAQLQMKLALLSDKLIEQKKYEKIKNKSVVGIGGKFSAGKSKFINSILNAGEELLPEDQNPTTSIPTYIVYDDIEEISAYTSDNNKVNLDTDALQALTHKFYEQYHMGFSYFINSLIISEPNMPYRKLAFLDTPGYSKANTSHKGRNQAEISDENKAYAQLRNVDYLIWLVDIENGVLSESDIEFILKLKIETPILIVVNKSDKKIDEDIKEIVDLIQTTANYSGIDVFGVAAYSSRNKEEWGGGHIISDFLELAKKKKSNNDNIVKQINEIYEIVSLEIDEKIDKKIDERDALNDIIFRANDINEIQTLVELYGETMEDIRDMKECRKKYHINMKILKKALEKQYGGRWFNG